MTTIASSGLLRPSRARATGRGPIAVIASANGLTWVARILMVSALVVCFVTIPAIFGAKETSYGLLFAGVPGVTIAIGLAVLAFVAALRAGSSGDAWVATIVAVLCMRLPIALGTNAPMYAWTYKHLGVIDWIQHHGHVATGVDVYSGWPGVFAVIAWFSTITGISPTSIAQWFEVGVNLALVCAVGALARSLGTTRLTSVTAAFIAGAANWVGQDYLSPQAVSYLLGVVVATLLVRSRTRPVFAWLSLPIFAAIAVSHQLTPYWLIAAAIPLGLIGAARPRLIGIAFVVIAGAVALVNLPLVQQFATGTSLNPVANAATLAHGFGSAGKTLTGNASRAVTLALCGTASVMALVGLRPDRFGGSRLRRWATLRTAILAFAPFALLAGQNYGGEAIFRVFLYSIPGCAVLVAPVVVRGLRVGRTVLPSRGRGRTERLSTVPASTERPFAARPSAARPSIVRPTAALLSAVGRRITVIGTAFAVVAVSLLSAQATYGSWFSNNVQASVDAISTQLLRTMPVPSTVITPSSASPNEQTQQYVEQARANPAWGMDMSTWNGWIDQDFTDPLVERRLTDDLSTVGHPVFLMFTDQMEAWADYNGAYPHGGMRRFQRQIAGDARWERVVAAPGVVLYRLKETDG